MSLKMNIPIIKVINYTLINIIKRLLQWVYQLLKLAKKKFSKEKPWKEVSSDASNIIIWASSINA